MSSTTASSSSSRAEPEARSPDCARCRYDTTGITRGEPCPECGEPFDPRPDAPRAQTYSALALVSGVVVLGLHLAASPIIALMLTVVVFGFANDVRRTPPEYRVRPAHALRARVGSLLAFIGLGVLITYRLLAPLVPISLRWW